MNLVAKKLGFIAAFVMAALPSLAVVYYVHPAGNNTTGLSWVNAKTTVTGAIALAVAGDQIWVAKGVYFGSHNLKDSVRWYGGFVGGEVLLSQRNPDLNRSVLDGGFAVSTVVITGASASTRIDGFVVQNGFAVRGAGIYALPSDATITRCRIRRNVAQRAGGGIYLEGGAVNIYENRIAENFAQSPAAIDGQGGGIFALSGSHVIANNNIARNEAHNTAVTGTGGGIYNSDSFLRITNNTIVENAADAPGAAFANAGVLGASFTNNIVAFNQSGVVNIGAPYAPDSNCFWMNTLGDLFGYLPVATDIFVDPQMINIATDNYHLDFGSPSKDTGNNAFAIGTEDVDQDARIINAKVDRGADEYGGTGLVGSISGKVEPGPGYVGLPTDIFVTIEIRSPGSLIPIESFSTYLDAGLQFYMPTGVPAGLYDVAVKGSHWLRNILPSVPITESGAIGLFVKLTNGDCDGNNYNNTDDYLILSDSFDQGPGDPFWDPRADLDGNMYVNTDDYLILSDNFDIQDLTDPYPCPLQKCRGIVFVGDSEVHKLRTVCALTWSYPH